MVPLMGSYSSAALAYAPPVSRRPACGGSLRRRGCSWRLKFFQCFCSNREYYYVSQTLMITKDDERSHTESVVEML